MAQRIARNFGLILNEFIIPWIAGNKSGNRWSTFPLEYFWNRSGGGYSTGRISGSALLRNFSSYPLFIRAFVSTNYTRVLDVVLIFFHVRIVRRSIRIYSLSIKNGKEESRVFHGKKKKEERDAKSNPEINRHLITVPAYIRGPYKIIFFLYTFQA